MSVDSSPLFWALLDRFADGAALHQGGRLVYANPSMSRLLGYDSPDELVGCQWKDFMHADDVPVAETNAAEALSTRDPRPLGPVERRLLSRDGDERTVELSALVLELEAGPALLVIAHDLTSRKRLEAKLREAERMAAVGALAAGVAHEINNPLSYVIGNLAYSRQRLAELWGQRPPENESAIIEAIDEASQGVERMRQIVSDLKTFTRRDEGLLDRVELSPVLESALKIAQAELRHVATVEKRYGRTVEVLANEGRLAQVFLNLLINAAHAMEEGDPSTNRVTLTTTRDEAGWALVEISDNGPGIPDEILPRVLEPFFTTKPVGVGTGLGLSVCKNIIEGYGGRLELESRVGEGTTVGILLPPATRREPPRRASGTLHAVREKRYRVLVVDDDPLVRRSVARSLRQHEVVTAESGAEALRLIENREFDVVLCDLMMPEMTGMDVYAAISEQHPRVTERIAFLSGGAVTDRARSFLDSVPNLRFEKPLTPSQLEAALVEVAERK